MIYNKQLSIVIFILLLFSPACNRKSSSKSSGDVDRVKNVLNLIYKYKCYDYIMMWASGVISTNHQQFAKADFLMPSIFTDPNSDLYNPSWIQVIEWGSPDPSVKVVMIEYAGGFARSGLLIDPNKNLNLPSKNLNITFVTNGIWLYRDFD